jgi:hypothetical protein
LRKQLCCRTSKRLVPTGWISFQPDGSISFGLNDRTYISPRFKARHMIWNVYNRAKIRYEIASEPGALEPITNPHFTYHPIAFFHLKSRETKRGEALFEGLADLSIMLTQVTRVPWIRAISAPIDQLRGSGRRADAIDVEDLILEIHDERASVCMAVDFVRPTMPEERIHRSCWSIPWQHVGLQITLSFTFPQIPTLSWFHFY